MISLTTFDKCHALQSFIAPLLPLNIFISCQPAVLPLALTHAEWLCSHPAILPFLPHSATIICPCQFVTSASLQHTGKPLTPTQQDF